MSDIKVGDLVQVVRPRFCCPDKTRWGKVFVVGSIGLGPQYQCPYCNSYYTAETSCAWEVDSTFKGCELSRLKRIPPLDELEGVLAQTEIKHPITGRKVIA